MLFLVILLFVLLCFTAGVLVFRLIAVRLDSRRRIKNGLGNDTIARPLSRVVEAGVDQGLLLPMRDGRLADIEVVLREHTDPYRTVAELLESLIQSIGKETFDDRLTAIKCLYQLQTSLNLDVVALTDCLNDMIARLTMTTFAGKPIHRVELVSPGTLLDQRTMIPLDFGSHVRQPFGVVIFGENGKVLSKAKVFCS